MDALRRPPVREQRCPAPWCSPGGPGPLAFPRLSIGMYRTYAYPKRPGASIDCERQGYTEIVR